MSAVEFRPEGPELRAPADVIRWAIGGGEPPPEVAGSGVLEGGELHPRLELARRTVRDARVSLLLERGDRRGRGWLAHAGAVIAYPQRDGRVRLLMVPASLLMDAVVRLNDVGPRPHPDPALRIAAAPADLAQALAARDPDRLPLADAAQRKAFRAVVAGLREHWRVATRWDAADGALAGRDLEVIDTEGGYWLVVPDDPTVELWPATPTDVLRGLCRLFPLTTELRAWAPR